MKYFRVLCVLFVAGCVFVLAGSNEPQTESNHEESQSMKLGAFSVSLAVKDLAVSQAFYEKLGFKQIHGVIEQNWVILQNDGTTIGLFQGMFEKNIMTFNPGWDANQQTPDNFTDVRDLQAALIEKGIEIQTKADPDSTGPASLILVDPDGNTIFLDQHVDKPE